MRTAYVIGGARCWEEDYAATLGLEKASDDAVIVVNDIAPIWEGPVAAFVTLHGEKLRRWLADREAKGFPAPDRVFTGLSAAQNDPRITEVAEAVHPRFEGQEHGGSSGLFAAKVALVDLGFDRVILCGCPMTEGSGHVLQAEGWVWTNVTSYWVAWQEALPVMRGKVYSMSGYTRTLLGAPT